jgi:hypothetical protein
MPFPQKKSQKLENDFVNPVNMKNPIQVKPKEKMGVRRVFKDASLAKKSGEKQPQVCQSQ